MQTKKCYYVVLGIVKPSNEDEIRKAYKKLALKWHPDKNPDNIKEAEEMFKQIAEAYEVLSDKDKKAAYDRWGHEGLTTGGQTPGGHNRPGPFPGFAGSPFTFRRAEDIFQNLFSTGFFDDDDFFSSHFSPQSKGSRKNTPGSSPFGGLGLFRGFDHFGFDEPRSPFAGGSLFREFSTGSGGGWGSGGISKSTSTSTVIQNGKKVTVTKVTTTSPDGKKTVEIKETVSDHKGTTERHFLEDEGGQKREVRKIRQ